MAEGLDVKPAGLMLRTEISDYCSNARQLEIRRLTLARRIADSVKKEIIPAINQLLPAGYRFDPQYSYIRSVGGEPAYDPHVRNTAFGEVPTGFGIDLLLCYDGKPLSESNQIHRSIIKRVQRHLMPALDEMASKYNLEDITPCGTPDNT